MSSVALAVSLASSFTSLATPRSPCPPRPPGAPRMVAFQRRVGLLRDRGITFTTCRFPHSTRQLGHRRVGGPATFTAWVAPGPRRRRSCDLPDRAPISSVPVATGSARWRHLLRPPRHHIGLGRRLRRVGHPSAGSPPSASRRLGQAAALPRGHDITATKELEHTSRRPAASGERGRGGTAGPRWTACWGWWRPRARGT